MLQTIWYQVNSGQEIWVIGTILDDKTVRGGTGWGAEFAKLCNKTLFVFDQERDGWFWWTATTGAAADSKDGPLIMHPHFTGTGTRQLADNGKAAMGALRPQLGNVMVAVETDAAAGSARVQRHGRGRALPRRRRQRPNAESP